jgi:HPt (histidine-containing phosphotransfer) domain-containing protein
MAETIRNSMADAALVFDETAALDALGDDRELLAIVARAFVDEAPKVLARLHRAADDHDTKEIQAAGHVLKGSVRFFGDTPIYDLAYALETDARSGNLNRAPAEIAQLDVCVPRLAAALAKVFEHYSLARNTAPS